MKLITLFPAFLLAAMPLVASASECPDPPAGMKYASGGKTWAEASMNGAPFAKCTFFRNEADMLGDGYYFDVYKCPNFSFVHRGIGLTTNSQRIRDYHRDTFREKWYVIDKNENEWTVWESGLFIGWRSDNHKKGEGIKPIEEKFVRQTANGCSQMWKITATADRINLVVRRHSISKFAKKPVPTF